MPVPLIGVSGSIDKDETKSFILRDYMRSLTEAGAAPLLLSPDMGAEEREACVCRLDGLMLAGGNDVSPTLFDQQPISALGEVNPLRDELEIPLIHGFLEAQKPIFGICRGIQMVNVALGGSLYQDIPSQYHNHSGVALAHQQSSPAWYPSHQVEILEGSLLYRLLGQKRVAVNSFHHQAVQALGKGLVLSAWGEDGVVEAIELPSYPFLLAVQWHPERMAQRDEAARRLFGGFVRAAEQAMAS